MVVQHNLQAANTNRQLGITTSAQAKSTEKLSSGYKINRAADDAAGLSISEKMRSQIRGLNKASSNAQDGVSLVQTAEGALNETHSILQRMNELATQAANGTNTSVDRSAIRAELDQLTSEINRIQSTTQFNTMNLLDGTFSGATKQMKLQVGALSGQSINFSIANMCASKIGLKKDLSVSTFTKAGSYMKSKLFLNSVQQWVLSRTVWSIQLPTWIPHLRIPSQQNPVSVIQIWLLKWLHTARITSLLRQVSLC